MKVCLGLSLGIERRVFNRLFVNLRQQRVSCLLFQMIILCSFLLFGGRTLSAMVAMNLIERSDEGAAYIDTGLWSQLAFSEAQRQGHAREVLSAKEAHYCAIPEVTTSLDDLSYSLCAYG